MSQHIGETIIYIESTKSTNNYASEQVRENEVEGGTVFLTYNQTAGRGQLANTWESEPERNLTFSIFIRPDFLEIARQFMLSKVVCFGLQQFLSRYVDRVTIKWPNDIYVGDRKICGILIENAVMNGKITQSIIGVGLNVNQTEFLSNAPNPVSLKMLTGRKHDLKELISELLETVDHSYRKLANGQFKAIDKGFLNNLYHFQSWHSYKDKDHSYTGKIVGVNSIGQLRIQEKDGPVWEYHFKEVEYL
ncbi:MAG TPA: biotin--[acetyl-CoA-carboxylase] ligase [Sunxiuqinia sp.]|nr:biotin--[acetyl-CoA-carboxylase] ligase [Sunxiuqinia sp.]